MNSFKSTWLRYICEVFHDFWYDYWKNCYSLGVNTDLFVFSYFDFLQNKNENGVSSVKRSGWFLFCFIYSNRFWIWRLSRSESVNRICLPSLSCWEIGLEISPISIGGFLRIQLSTFSRECTVTFAVQKTVGRVAGVSGSIRSFVETVGVRRSITFVGLRAVSKNELAMKRQFYTFAAFLMLR